jgi:hypothetical protein
MSEEILEFEVQLTTFGADMRLREKNREELLEVIEEHTNVHPSCVSNIRVNGRRIRR